jgi:hypothetical protein
MDIMKNEVYPTPLHLFCCSLSMKPAAAKLPQWKLGTFPPTTTTDKESRNGISHREPS